MHIFMYTYSYIFIYDTWAALDAISTRISLDIVSTTTTMGWLRFIGSLKSKVSFAKEPYKRDDMLQ